jgi:uncharacterized protein (DUF849 family)
MFRLGCKLRPGPLARDSQLIRTPNNVTIMADSIYSAGVKPELEVFSTGNIQLAQDLLRAGTQVTIDVLRSGIA